MTDLLVDPAAVETVGSQDPSLFTVRLTNFTGPFDLLLALISQHRLDVTEVALHTVTDDFVAHTRALGPAVGLEQTTAFLVVAATLLDLKAARLLPAAEVDSEEDLQLLEARDLLFARLLQYRAYKQVAALMAELEAGALRSYPRSVSLEERYESLLPEVLLGVDAQRLAEIAAAALAPRPPAPTVGVDHLHLNTVSVREHAATVLALLRGAGRGEWVDFAVLVAGCTETAEVVARFLGLLELHRDGVVHFAQDEALGALRAGWTGDEPGDRVGADW
ncbi:segregation/condensation protein A [Rhodococcus aerolatus]